MVWGKCPESEWAFSDFGFRGFPVWASFFPRSIQRRRFLLNKYTTHSCFICKCPVASCIQEAGGDISSIILKKYCASCKHRKRNMVQSFYQFLNGADAVIVKWIHQTQKGNFRCPKKKESHNWMVWGQSRSAPFLFIMHSKSHCFGWALISSLF